MIDQLLGACALCGSGTAHGLCPGCRADLPRLDTACRLCAAPLPVAGVCGHCQRKPPPYAAAVAAFGYAPPLSDLILALKFHRRLYVAGILGRLLAEKLVSEPAMDLLVPVPLYPGRLVERGYNQALELARPVSALLNVPLAPMMCRRERDTASQSGLDRKERRSNVRAAFAAAPQVRGQRVAILDDVVTTGSTVAELARSLYDAGASEVRVWALARAGH